MTPRFSVSLFVLAGTLAAQDPGAAPAKAAYLTKALYPLTTCVVSGEPLGADAVTFEAGGRTFRTCCPKCQPKVEKEPATFAKKLDEALVKAQLPNYPLDTCVISGKKLGSMGDPVQLVLDGTLVQLCCDGCTKRATAKAGEMAQKVRDAAFAAQGKTYPLGECVVSGEKLGKDAVAVMFGTKLVRFCCEKCVAKFEKDPAAFLPKLNAKAPKEGAGAAKPGKDGAAGGCCCDTADAAAVEKAGSASAAGCCGNCAGTPPVKAADKTDKKVEGGKAGTGGDCCESDPAKGKPQAPAKKN